MLNPLPVIDMLTIGAIAMFLMMLAFWILNLGIKNAGLVDVGWALGLVLLSIIYFVKADGYLPRQLMAFGMVTIWGLRLIFLLLFRLLTDRHEDPRYLRIREGWGSHANFRFFFLFLSQGFLALILSVPFLAACINPLPRITAIEWVGLFIWFLGVVGETLSDDQMRIFKSDPANKDKVCQTGLWNYSRHPNYFFEWVIWMGFFAVGLSHPLGLFGIISPLLMLYFLLQVTGVPLAEAQSLKSRGDAYRAYQRTTSVFFPWFKKS